MELMKSSDIRWNHENFSDDSVKMTSFFFGVYVRQMYFFGLYWVCLLGKLMYNSGLVWALMFLKIDWKCYNLVTFYLWYFLYTGIMWKPILIFIRLDRRKKNYEAHYFLVILTVICSVLSTNLWCITYQEIVVNLENVYKRFVVKNILI